MKDTMIIVNVCLCFVNVAYLLVLIVFAFLGHPQAEQAIGCAVISVFTALNVNAILD